MTDVLGSDWKAGLEGVVAARTGLSRIDGDVGRLYLRGYPIEQLAPAACFEETVHLLWHGELPGPRALADLRARLAEHRMLPAATLSVLRHAARARLSPMEALRAGLETLDLDNDDLAAGTALLAATPVLVAAYARLLDGLEVVTPAPDAGLAAGFLEARLGRTPSPAEARGLETYLNTIADHGLNASTFTARVIASTRSDLRSAVVGALGALKGPIHGGAPEPVLEMLRQIERPEAAAAWIRAALARGERIMGFGHREYRVRDPRAQVLADAAAVAAERGPEPLHDLALAVEQIATPLLDAAKPGRNLRTNVEFYTAVLLHQLGIEPGLFTAVFAVGRTAGWIAHCLEQRRVARIFRPTSVYEGPPARDFVELSRR